jgi:MFS family permease
MGVFMGTGSALMFSAAAVALTAGQSEVVVPLLGTIQPWQAAFVLVGLPGLVVAALIGLGVREPQRQEVSNTGNSLRSAIQFLRGNWGLIAPLLLGFALNGLINYGLTTWVPTLFIRLHGWSAGSIGTTYGFILVAFGSAGVLFGGWLASRVPPSGSGAVRIARNSLAGTVPFIAVLATASSPWIDLSALSALAFLIGIPAAIAPVALYQVTPNAFRGQIIAFYLLGATVLGLGVGVTLIAISTDHLFHDDQAIGWSLGVVLIPAAGLAVLALDRARRKIEARLGL